MTDKKTPTTVLEALQCAREFLSVPEHWYKGGFTPLADYDDETPDTPCCAWGAINKCVTGSAIAEHELAERALDVLRRSVPSSDSPSSFNDAADTTHEDILALFDRAIQEVSA